MAKYYPSSEVDLGLARIAVVESVMGSFGDQCTLAQFQSNPDAFLVAIKGDVPILVLAHDGVEHGPDGWTLKSEPYNLDGIIPALLDQVLTVIDDIGAEAVEASVLHVADFDASGGEQTFSSWPVVSPTTLDISMALENVSDPCALTADQIDRLCRIISGTPIDDDAANDVEEPSEPDGAPATVEAALTDAFAGLGGGEAKVQEAEDTEIIFSGGSASDAFDIERVKRTPNVFDEEMVEVLSEMIGRMGFSAVTLDDREVDIDEILSSDGLFPALIVAAAHRWSLLLQARPNIPGFFVRLRTDKNALLGYRVEAVHSNSAGNIPVSIYQCLSPMIANDAMDSDLMEIIDVFHASMQAYANDAAISQAS